MAKIRLNMPEIRRQLKAQNKVHTVSELSKMLGVTMATLNYWNRVGSPAELVICYNLSSKVKNATFTSLVMSLGMNYPVINLLKYYHEHTGKDLEKIILID